MKRLLILSVCLFVAMSCISGTVSGQGQGKTGTAAKVATAAKIQPNTLVDINSATKDELEKLPGIGTAYSEKIIKEISNHPHRSPTEVFRKNKSDLLWEVWQLLWSHRKQETPESGWKRADRTSPTGPLTIRLVCGIMQAQ